MIHRSILAVSDLAASKRHSSFGTELRKARSLEVSIDLVDVVHELTLQIVPHRGLMLYKSESVEKKSTYMGKAQVIPCNLPDRFMA